MQTMDFTEEHADFGEDGRIIDVVLGNDGQRMFNTEGMLASIKASSHFQVRIPDSAGLRSSNKLIRKRYAWRGYAASQIKPSRDAFAITFCAGSGNTILGTVTLGIDGPHGLLCDKTYPDEMVSLRKSGERLCELTKLAVDETSLAKHVMGALFHVAYIYAHRFHKMSTLVIEVNPRHVGFYCRSLGFKQVGERKHCQRAGADAVLLRLSLAHVHQQIPIAGTVAPMRASRSLYPYFFSKHEEAGIASRICSLNRLPAVITNL